VYGDAEEKGLTVVAANQDETIIASPFKANGPRKRAIAPNPKHMKGLAKQTSRGHKFALVPSCVPSKSTTAITGGAVSSTGITAIFLPHFNFCAARLQVEWTKHYPAGSTFSVTKLLASVSKRKPKSGTGVPQRYCLCRKRQQDGATQQWRQVSVWSLVPFQVCQPD
jgi:hypothetical protein